ncbi:MAG: 2-amino-4-hydroxy-6-hydroxymethyldihydropteridine diphosphokinase [Candidatus Cyclonatronum sp.]|uniref:2-amino-4-hydroxy-6- hydroxymethyldihydropteridine diphosphokinase n=1 Tax=Cyclonatronum sp. TaxID=3024185 RepID=UPI0025C15EDC|nr:2-amino-4-hydroxy-6-hydroxymethyldihydropteridine diphosphokinase [Cyclonatronum sp.]MCC5934599.1 2-amino-4-hydroxy-6-hydroxymethyldihydropteridine diphosphokinase [Balneolales bacterium]MCH8485498.1 2-amino-4-hydroxy-6-hydroxymethyldihydropteridine diphosphokinase [Cyclonatronum sp.]
MAQVVIALGSNEGDRLTYLGEGLRCCMQLAGNSSGQPLLKSSVYESEAVGPADAPFLNAVAAFECLLPPERLLANLKQTEAAQGRDFSAVRWGNRPLDLDIISCGGLILDSSFLTIPHKSCHERAFVLMPLAEILPAWRHPRLNQTAAELLGQAPKMQVYKTALLW